MINDFRHFRLPNLRDLSNKGGGCEEAKSMPVPKGEDILTLAEVLVVWLLEDGLTGQPREPAGKQAERVAENGHIAS